MNELYVTNTYLPPGNSEELNPSMNALLSNNIQGWAKEWSLGCVNPASWLPLAVGASSRNLVFTDLTVVRRSAHRAPL